MEARLSKVIHAPIDEVFAFFDDPAMTLRVTDHAIGYEVVDVQPDGRRTFDVTMRAGANEWMQTIEQVLRERPTRLVTRGGSWTTDRNALVGTVATDRLLSTERDGTRVDVTIEFHLVRPFRRPVQSVQNWLMRGRTHAVLEVQLQLISDLIEGERST